ncbi:glycoside hydrolase family 127 protein [Streptomyces ipomoeae]|uniref:glycoside hydrolase family 127 protein n=1 Tax=Streptomyces ipomoeae TaxID=103232 RepID=UPI0011476EF9|nr:beta-L-arabinofuranosidase domain-containing protein [Streptomyces ipomoeae]MDX2935976.1 glycoside hydrolase family 127 protein [Streptomyces ipomoeae]TQE14762.1 glycoside hydrolase family 127 protein [Streptomyces ipomoeae]
MNAHLAPGPVHPTPNAVTVLRPARLARIEGGFWAERRRVNAEVSIPEGPGRLEAAGNLANLRAAAELRRADRSPSERDDTAPHFVGDFQFQDSDVHKWLEAACWQLADAPDPVLAADVERIVTLLADAQDDNGYLQTYYQLGGGEPWTELGWGHELYCAGHLMQAAVAHHRATGSHRLLDVARRFADHIETVLGPGGPVDGVCGHPEVETALVELHRATGERRHLDLARHFLDRRGHGTLAAGADRGHDRDPGPAYWQDHTPVREADEVTGHAVRQLYLLAGAADLAAESGDAGLRAALERLWEDMVGTKTYLTGGVGSRHDWESFGDAYELPSDRAYAETCAAIASVQFSWRMALLTGEARYSDLIERTLFNGFLAGVGLDGRTWLYVNPLHLRAHPHERPGDQTAHRTPWFRCACCPPNAMRLLASLPHYVASTDGGEHDSAESGERAGSEGGARGGAPGGGLRLHQYATGVYGAAGLTVRVATEYPWDGTVTVTVQSAPAVPRTLSLRLPSWCAAHSLTVNGTAVHDAAEGGWLRVTREFRAGDTVRLDLVMPPRLTSPHPRVDAVRGCVAVERGPLVYCLEQSDQPGGLDPDDALLDPAAPLTTRRRPDLLGGVTTVTASAHVLPPAAPGTWPYAPQGTRPPVSDEPMEVTAVPYYAWANRGPGAMRVWIRTVERTGASQG